MKNQLKKILSILLIASMVPDFSIALQPGVRSPHHLQASEGRTSRLLLEALSPATVSQHRFPFEPFVSFWSQLQPSPLFLTSIRKESVLRRFAFGTVSAIAIGVLHHLGASWSHLLSVGLMVPIMAVVSGMNPPPPSPFVDLQMDPLDPEHPQEIFIHVDANQPGIFREITRALHALDLNINPGSSIEPTEDGSLIHLVLDFHVASAREAIAHLRIPRMPPSQEPTVRYSISVMISNSSGALDQLLEQIHEAIPSLNIERLTSAGGNGDDVGWVQLDEVTVPVQWKGYGTLSPDEYLKRLLRNIAKQPFRLVREYEVAPAEVNRATLEEFVNILEADTSRSFGRWLMNQIASIPTSLGWKGRIDSSEVESFRQAYEIAKTAHLGEKRIRRGHPDYITHPKAVFFWLLKWGVTDPSTLKLSLIHDVTEKLKRPELLLMIEKLGHVFASSRRRLLPMLEFISNYTQGRYDIYAKRLTARGEINLLAVKLADMLENLDDIFEIDLQENPKFSPSRQFAKRLRFGLPIVSWTPALKNDVYRNSRRDFLNVLIAQSEDPRLIFKTLYLSDGEDPVKASAELIIHIGEFLRWIERNSDCLPTDVSMDEVGPERIEAFKRKLIDLRIWLKSNAAEIGDLTEPALLVADQGFVSRRTFLKEVYRSAKQNGMAIVLGSQSVGKSSLFNGNGHSPFLNKEEARFVHIDGPLGQESRRIYFELPHLLMDKMEGLSTRGLSFDDVWPLVRRKLGGRVLVLDETLGYLDSDFERSLMTELEVRGIPYVVLTPVSAEIEEAALTYQSLKENPVEIFHLKPFNRADTKSVIAHIRNSDKNLSALTMDDEGVQYVYDLTGGIASQIRVVMTYASKAKETGLRSLSQLKNHGRLLDPDVYYGIEPGDDPTQVPGPLSGIQPEELEVLRRFVSPIALGDIEKWTKHEQYIVAFLTRYGHLERVGLEVQIRGRIQRATLRLLERGTSNSDSGPREPFFAPGTPLKRSA